MGGRLRRSKTSTSSSESPKRAARQRAARSSSGRTTASVSPGELPPPLGGRAHRPALRSARRHRARCTRRRLDLDGLVPGPTGGRPSRCATGCRCRPWRAAAPRHRRSRHGRGTVRAGPPLASARRSPCGSWRSRCRRRPRTASSLRRRATPAATVARSSTGDRQLRVGDADVDVAAADVLLVGQASLAVGEVDVVRLVGEIVVDRRRQRVGAGCNDREIAGPAADDTSDRSRTRCSRTSPSDEQTGVPISIIVRLSLLRDTSSPVRVRASAIGNTSPTALARRCVRRIDEEEELLLDTDGEPCRRQSATLAEPTAWRS